MRALCGLLYFVSNISLERCFNDVTWKKFLATPLGRHNFRISQFRKLNKWLKLILKFMGTHVCLTLNRTPKRPSSINFILG